MARNRLKILFVLDPRIAIPLESYGGTERFVWTLASKLALMGQDISIVARIGSYSSFAKIFPASNKNEIRQFLNSNARHFDVICDCSKDGRLFQKEEAMGNFVNYLDSQPIPSFDIEKPNVVANSHAFAKKIKEEIGADPVVIYPGMISAEDYPNPIADWDKKSDNFIYVGRIMVEKGPLDAVRFCKKVGKHIDIVGGSVPISFPKSAFVKIGKRIARSGIPIDNTARLFRQDGIAYTFRTIREQRGWGRYLENVSLETRNALYASSLGLVFPVNWEEPLGITPVEAAALGTPTVAYSRAAMPEVIEDGVTGFLIMPGDGTSFVEALKRIKTLDPRDCIKFATEKFSLDKTANSYLKLFSEAASGKRW